ncbi:hypothetical protein AOLI_G00188290 [Acnodon oligacanthus]
MSGSSVLNQRTACLWRRCPLSGRLGALRDKQMGGSSLCYLFSLLRFDFHCTLEVLRALPGLPACLRASPPAFIMITYLQVFVLSLVICAGSLSAQSTVYLSVTVGSTAVLPCDCRHITSTQSASQTLHVEWRTFAETVFERMGEELYQGEGYEGRVDVREDELLKGDCSLELKNVRPEDAGMYESFLLVQQAKRSMRSKRVFLQSVELSVDEESHSENKPQARSAGVIQTSSQITVFILLANILFHLI